MGQHAFISYVREDEAVVKRVQGELERAGIDVWRDVDDIEPGRPWRDAVAEAMRTKKLVFLGCFSESAVAQETSGQMTEINDALKLAQTGDVDLHIIPIRLDSCAVPSLDLSDAPGRDQLGRGVTLRDLQRVDLFGDDVWEAGIATLVKEVRDLLFPALTPAAAWWWLPEQEVLDGVRRGRRWPGGIPSVSGRRLSGHPSGVTSVVSLPIPGGTLVATTCFGAVRLWDPETGEPRIELPADPYAMFHAACTVPVEGRLLLATTGDSLHRIRLWDPLSGEAVGDPFGPTSDQLALCPVPMPDGNVLLACGGHYPDPTVSLWDPVTQQRVGEPLPGHDTLVTCVCAVPVAGRTLLASGSHDSTIRLWDPVSQQPYEQGTWLASERGNEGIYDLCVVPDSDRTVIVAACGDGHVRFWDVLTGQLIDEPKWGHQGIVLAVCAVPVGERALVASAGHSGTVRLWNPATAAPIGSPLAGAGAGISSLCSVPLGPTTVLASGTHDGAVQLWEPPRSGSAPYPLQSHTAHEDTVLRGHAGAVRSLCAAPDDEGRVFLASSADDGTVRFWDPAGSHGEPLPTHGGRVEAICSVRVADRNLVATTGTAKTGAGSAARIQLWDPATALPYGRPIVTDGASHMCTVPEDEQLLATATVDGHVVVWNPSTHRSKASFTVGGPLAALCAIPLLGEFALATIKRNGAIRLWTVEGDRVGPRFRAGLRLHRPHDVTAAAVVRTPSSVGLALGDEGGTLRLWDIKTGRLAQRPRVHRRSPVLSICALPVAAGGTLVAAGFGDGTVLLIDPTAGRQIGELLYAHDDAATAACVIPSIDGPTLATASREGSIRLRSHSSMRTVWVTSSEVPPGFDEQMRAELENDQGRARLRGDIATWLEEFGRRYAHGTVRWDGEDGVAAAAIHDEWSSRPEPFVEQLEAISSPLGGWAAYGAHKLIWEVLGGASRYRAGRAIHDVAIRFARSEGINLVPWEIDLADALGILHHNSQRPSR